MNEKAAIQATFSDFRIVKSRKIAQLVCEVPLEQADAALATLGGLPQPAAERWVALAALNVTSIKPRGRRKWDDLALSAQASIRCEEPAFQRFLRERCGWTGGSGQEAVAFVRHVCGVSSRKGLNDDPIAAGKWVSLDSEYDAWMREPRHA